MSEVEPRPLLPLPIVRCKSRQRIVPHGRRPPVAVKHPAALNMAIYTDVLRNFATRGWSAGLGQARPGSADLQGLSRGTAGGRTRLAFDATTGTATRP